MLPSTRGMFKKHQSESQSARTAAAGAKARAVHGMEPSTGSSSARGGRGARRRQTHGGRAGDSTYYNSDDVEAASRLVSSLFPIKDKMKMMEAFPVDRSSHIVDADRYVQMAAGLRGSEIPPGGSSVPALPPIGGPAGGPLPAGSPSVGSPIKATASFHVRSPNGEEDSAMVHDVTYEETYSQQRTDGTRLTYSRSPRRRRFSTTTGTVPLEEHERALAARAAALTAIFQSKLRQQHDYFVSLLEVAQKQQPTLLPSATTTTSKLIEGREAAAHIDPATGAMIVNTPPKSPKSPLKQQDAHESLLPSRREIELEEQLLLAQSHIAEAHDHFMKMQRQHKKALGKVEKSKLEVEEWKRLLRAVYVSQKKSEGRRNSNDRRQSSLGGLKARDREQLERLYEEPQEGGGVQPWSADQDDKRDADRVNDLSNSAIMESRNRKKMNHEADNSDPLQQQQEKQQQPPSQNIDNAYPAGLGIPPKTKDEDEPLTGFLPPIAKEPVPPSGAPPSDSPSRLRQLQQEQLALLGIVEDEDGDRAGDAADDTARTTATQTEAVAPDGGESYFSFAPQRGSDVIVASVGVQASGISREEHRSPTMSESGRSDPFHRASILPSAGNKDSEPKERLLAEPSTSSPGTSPGSGKLQAKARRARSVAITDDPAADENTSSPQSLSLPPSQAAEGGSSSPFSQSPRPDSTTNERQKSIVTRSPSMRPLGGSRGSVAVSPSGPVLPGIAGIAAAKGIAAVQAPPTGLVGFLVVTGIENAAGKPSATALSDMLSAGTRQMVTQLGQSAGNVRASIAFGSGAMDGGKKLPQMHVLFCDGDMCLIAFPDDPLEAFRACLDHISNHLALAFDVFRCEHSFILANFPCYESKYVRAMRHLSTHAAKGEILVTSHTYRRHCVGINDDLTLKKLEVTLHSSLLDDDLYSIHRRNAVPRRPEPEDAAAAAAQNSGKQSRGLNRNATSSQMRHLIPGSPQQGKKRSMKKLKGSASGTADDAQGGDSSPLGMMTASDGDFNSRASSSGDLKSVVSMREEQLGATLSVDLDQKQMRALRMKPTEDDPTGLTSRFHFFPSPRNILTSYTWVVPQEEVKEPQTSKRRGTTRPSRSPLSGPQSPLFKDENGDTQEDFSPGEASLSVPVPPNATSTAVVPQKSTQRNSTWQQLNSISRFERILLVQSDNNNKAATADRHSEEASDNSGLQTPSADDTPRGEAPARINESDAPYKASEAVTKLESRHIMVQQGIQVEPTRASLGCGPAEDIIVTTHITQTPIIRTRNRASGTNTDPGVIDEMDFEDVVSGINDDDDDEDATSGLVAEVKAGGDRTSIVKSSGGGGGGVAKMRMREKAMAMMKCNGCGNLPIDVGRDGDPSTRVKRLGTRHSIGMINEDVVPSAYILPCGHIHCHECVTSRVKRELIEDGVHQCQYRCSKCSAVTLEDPVPCPALEVALYELKQRGFFFTISDAAPKK